MRHLIILLLLIFPAALPGRSATVGELPLPEVPDSLIAPADRASFIVSHFWDGMEFGDTVRSRDMEFIEQNFVNYLSLFPHVPADSLQKAVTELMRAAEADTVAYNLVADMADKYLYDVESPMFDEEFYLLFLQPVTKDKFMESNRRSRFDFELEDVMKNRRGTIASDFQYVDNTGAVRSFHLTGDESRMKALFFYDPDCGHCHEAADELQSDTTVSSMIADGSLAVVAIYAEGDPEMWQSARDMMPPTWINGYSPEDEVELSGAYTLRQTPTILLVAPDNTVLLKDTTAGKLIEFLKSK